MAYDWNKINSLLGVIHAASSAGPKFTKYASKANEELEAHWDEENPKPEPEVVEEPEADEGPVPTPNNGRRV